MVGNKKIVLRLTLGGSLMAMVSCGVQRADYVRLYVDQSNDNNQGLVDARMEATTTKEFIFGDDRLWLKSDDDSTKSPCCEHAQGKMNPKQKEVVLALTEILNSQALVHKKLDAIQTFLLDDPAGSSASDLIMQPIYAAGDSASTTESSNRAQKVGSVGGAGGDQGILSSLQEKLVLMKDSMLLLREQLHAESEGIAKADTSLAKAPIFTRMAAVINPAPQDGIDEELTTENDRIDRLEDGSKTGLEQALAEDTLAYEALPAQLAGLGVDTILLVAYYDAGDTMPKNEVLDAVQEIMASKEVLRIDVFGHAELDGEQGFNELTSARLDYIAAEINAKEPVEGLVFHTYGDGSSPKKDRAGANEVEIRILAKGN